MVTYRKKRNSYSLIIGILVFALAMTITFADVYGLSHFDYSYPGDTPPDYDGSSQEILNMEMSNILSGAEEYVYDPDLPTATVPPVPEPTTLALFAIGCGALLAGRKKMKR